MENFKFFLFSIVIIILIGFSGYWAFSTIESGSSHVDNQELKTLKNENEDLQKEIEELNSKINLLESDKNALINQAQSKVTEDITKSTNTDSKIDSSDSDTSTNTYKYQTLIDELQKLVNNNAYLKLKSQGAYVGSIQKFLNIYNNTSNKIDNDYGAKTVTLVKDFQKDQGLTADGEVGVGTLKKMISWLKTK